MKLLRQNTGVTKKIGPFLDSTDGITPETSLSIPQSSVLLSKSGASLAQKAETTAGAHDANGWYDILLSAADTDTLGELVIDIQVSGAIPVWERFTVVPAVVYDALVAGTDRLDVGECESNVDMRGTDSAITSLSGIALEASVQDVIVDIAALTDFDPETDIVEGALSYGAVLRILLSALAGITTGGGVNFRDNANSKNRIAATLDGSGNRTAMTLDGD